MSHTAVTVSPDLYIQYLPSCYEPYGSYGSQCSYLLENWLPSARR